MKKLFGLMIALVLLAEGCAFAETVSFEGTVTAGAAVEIYAPIGGTVGTVLAEAGRTVKAGDALAELTTEKVYAEESGTVTGVFGQPGDSADTVSKKYGAVMYIEGKSVYTISASTDKAYDSAETKFVHAGEQVYLVSYSDSDHTGTGVITSIEGTSYTVEVLGGEFLIGETVNVYRGGEAKAAARIGRGTLSRKTPTAVSGSGSIVSFAVADGDTVERGDLLFETLDGSFDGLYMSGSTITSSVAGTVAQVNAKQGEKLQKGSVAAVIYPEGSMRIEAQVPETDLANLKEGDAVEIELIWNQDDEIVYPGVISAISAIAAGSSGNGAQGDSGENAYTVYVDFTPDADTRYGMNAIVSTPEAAYEEPAEIEEEVEEPMENE